MTADEYKCWEREHVKSQPPQASVITAAYESYKRFCTQIGVKVPSQQSYELGLRPIGSWLPRKDEDED